MQFQWVDLIFIVIIGLSSITGLLRGFIKEFIALGVWILAVWVGYNYSGALNPYLQPYIQDQSIRTILGFIIVVLGVLIAGGIANAILGLFLRGSGLGAMDKVLGGIFGFARGVFILSLIFAILSMTSLPYQQYVQSSRIYNQLVPVINWISGSLPGLINKAKQTVSANESFNFIDISPDL
ncbi:MULTISPECIES: CvpA family protein [Legionella]|uniref:CvpA family protein n=1 Tax=Legionella resiliens TaxID=2905958 RepID=A0ABS8X572_9GAMM|nr:MULTISPECIES: CvpA family protein [unclassified Legionella]MCE0723496.1 CvpA family protein [Legionella sp. 9fVS26]MCE3532650.1 CvpA family protein [Legionella sp. 8cVS16]QLZ68784.1 colicin V biosynthesis protein [Legionella sp. PC1000]